MKLQILLPCLLTLLAVEHGVFGALVNVVVGPGLEYHPKKLEINVGDTVVWQWAYPSFGVTLGKVPHTVTKSLSFERKCDYVEEYKKSDLEIFHTGPQLSGFTFKVTFLKPENVTYHCETTGRSCLNCAGGMWGQIFVLPSGAKTEIVDLTKYAMKSGYLAPGPVQDLADAGVKFFANVFG